jgi:hypothetical protein
MRFRALIPTAIAIAITLLSSGIAEAAIKVKPLW